MSRSEPAAAARRALAHPRDARLLVDGLTPTGAADLGVELADLLEHTNTAHAEELLQFVVRLSGTAPTAIGGVQLAHLDREGTTVRWVDVEGANEVAVRFPERATSCHRLGELLSQALRTCGH